MRNFCNTKIDMAFRLERINNRKSEMKLHKAFSPELKNNPVHGALGYLFFQRNPVSAMDAD